MFAKILKAIVPNWLHTRAEEKAQWTQKVIDQNRQVRRDAEAQMFHSYRSMGQAIERHDWRD